MASNTAMPCGYDYEFVQEVPEDYTCIICKRPMRNPVETRCGHIFCKTCLEEAYKRNPNICPMDKGCLTAQDVFPSKFRERKILSLMIKCPHQGCDWQGELRDIESHETRCEHKVVQCDNDRCSVKKARREMVVHVQEECQYRMVPCPHCNNITLFCLLKVHESKCLKYRVSCPNGCVKTVKREEVAGHLSDECPLTIVPCAYHNIGCVVKVHRKDLDDHIEHQNKQHLYIAIGKIVSLQEQMDAMKKAATLTNKRTQKQMNEMKKAATLTNERTKKQMDKMKETNERIQRETDEMKKAATLTNELTQEQMDDICTTFQRQVDEMKNQMSAMPCMGTVEHIQTQIDAIKKDIHPPTIEDIVKVIPPNAPIMTKDNEGHYNYVWKITDRNQILQETRRELLMWATSLIIEPFRSEPFYTHKCGYNLHLVLQGGNKKVIVKLCAIQGDYDDKLTWPPPWNTIKFILLDQTPNPLQLNHIENRAAVYKGMRLNKRPLKYQSILIASVNCDERLYQENYLVKDTIFFKIQIL